MLFRSDADSRGPENTTALYWAAATGHLETARALLEHGSDVNGATASGETPLHAAAWGRESTPCVMRCLLDRGAAINARTDKGRTPLHAAAHEGYEDRVRLLVTYGADTAIRNDHGQTAEQVARSKGHAEVAAHLHELAQKQSAQRRH